MSEPRYRTLAHTADTGIEVEAATLGELYAGAAFGMFDLFVDLQRCVPAGDFTVDVAGASPAEVMVELLGELVAQAEIRSVIPCRFAVDAASATRARLRMGVVPAAGVELRGPPVKAVTYHDLEVSETAHGWYARIVFDV